MKIDSVYLTRVQVPLRLAFVSANGIRRYYQKTVVRLVTRDGLIGYGETDGSDAVFARACQISKDILDHEFSANGVPFDPSSFAKYRSAPLFDRIAVGGIEMACWDIAGKLQGQPIHQLLGGYQRSQVDMVCELSAGPFASDEPSNSIESYFADLRNVDRVVQAGVEAIALGGYRTLKQKSIGKNVDWDFQVMKGFREALGPEFELRHDPNGAYTTAEAMALYRKMDSLDLQWYEDPTSGIDGMRDVRNVVSTRLATNMCVTDFAQLDQAIKQSALDVVGIDPFHWAGLANAREAISVCEANGLSFFCHHFLDLGITTAAMLHLAASIPELPNGMDTSLYLQGTDIVLGGEFKVKNGALGVPLAPGLGVEVDETAVKKFMIDECKCRSTG
jgi:glucarate dehydratase